MRPTSGMDGAAMDTEYHYPGLHLDVDPQSYCSEDTGTADAVREFLDNLLYGDDKYVFFLTHLWEPFFPIPLRTVFFSLDFHFFSGILWPKTTQNIGPWVGKFKVSST